MIKYQAIRIRRRDFDLWNRDEDYEAVVMSEKGSIVGCKGTDLLVEVENAATCGGERPIQRSQWKDEDTY